MKISKGSISSEKAEKFLKFQLNKRRICKVIPDGGKPLFDPKMSKKHSMRMFLKSKMVSK